MSNFDDTRKAVLTALLDLDQAIAQLEGAVPLDDHGLGLDRLTLAQKQSGDDLVMWLAHYDRPALDPSLTLEEGDL